MTKSLKFKCSVIGANGYLGRHLTYLLIERGYEVFAYDVNETRNINIPDSVSYNEIDITQKHDISKIRFDVDFLFFFAGITGTKEGFENYEKYIQVNELGVLNVLNEIRALLHKPCVVFPSTRLVYKGSEFPLKEDDEKEAKTIYAVNKLAGEYMLHAYHNAYDIPFLIFRICVPYGNLFDDNFSYGTIGNFLKKARNMENIVLYGDGSLKRTFTHVVSVCNQIIDAASVGNAVNEVFNINGETYSLYEAASIVADRYNVKVDYIAWPEEDMRIESGNTVFDSTKLLKIIANKEEFSFKDWICSLVE
jgi:UDP-glucose 4-epimerase